MKKKIIAFMISLVMGGIAGAITTMLISSQGIMLENESRFDFVTTITTIQQSATAENWSIPAIHDLQNSMAKAGKKVGPVKVIALCNPEYAVKILNADDERIYSNMMPCRVSVYTKSDGKTYVSRLNIPKISRKMPAEVKTTMKEAYRDIETILTGIVVK